MLRWTPTLLFHEVLPDDTNPLPAYAITRSTLRTIVWDFLKRGYAPGKLEAALGEGQAKGRRLVLTFDDGTLDFAQNALPVLEETGHCATLFIVTGQIGGTRDWKAWKAASSGELLDPVPLMDGDQLRELHRQGFVLGSHTVTHAPLPALSKEDARRELAESKVALEELTDEPVEWFAYPYVAQSSKTRLLVKEAGYRGACGGYNGAHSRYYMNRIEASAFTLPQLRLRTNGLYHATRYVARRLRGRAI